MAASRAYLDHNATSPVRPEARAAVLAALDLVGNASAVHVEGRAARKIIENARADVAKLAEAEPAAVTFTSGGSEGAALVLAPGFGIGSAPPAQRLIVSAVEHSCVLSGGRFEPGRISLCPVDHDGVIDMDALAHLLSKGDGIPLVALMAANNETGVVQPVAAAADLVHARGGYLVCDAVQALGKLPLDLGSLHADALILSGHKIGAPQGVGAAVLHGDARLPTPLIRGGGQEDRRRGGTENLTGIAGFGAAARTVIIDSTHECDRMRELRDWMERELVTISKDVVIFGGSVSRLPNTSLVALPGMNGETAVIAFDLAGVSVATGSACTSGKVAPSHVLAAMGVEPEVARAAIRVSLGWSTTRADVTRFLEVWDKHRRQVFARRCAA